jgi:hypothetical protein
MTSLPFFPRLASLLSLSVLAFMTVTAAGDDQPAQQQGQQPAPRPRRADATKMVRIEKPIRQIVARNSAAIPAAADPSNPKVEPGLVKWHPSFADACAASRRSGKPVLLFQMMGKLDDKFC